MKNNSKTLNPLPDNWELVGPVQPDSPSEAATQKGQLFGSQRAERKMTAKGKKNEASDHHAPCWRELYKAAMVEFEPSKLPERVRAARTAMAQQLAELEKTRSTTIEERWEITDAMASLEYWASFKGK